MVPSLGSYTPRLVWFEWQIMRETREIIDNHVFALIFKRFGAWMPKNGKGRPVAPIETFPRCQAGFLLSEDFRDISQVFTICYGFWRFS